MEEWLFQPIRPMLASFGNEAFEDEEFLFDVKWGRRLLVHKQGRRVEAYTRFGRCVTEQFPELQDVAGAIREETAVLDCEGIVLRDGRPGFDSYLHRLRLTNSVSIKKATVTHPATFVALDVLVSGERAWFQTPLQERKQRLQAMIGEAGAGKLISSPFVRGSGKTLYAEAVRRGFEGIVAKRVGSLYVPDSRSKDWIKVKIPHEIDCLILGYRPGPPFALVLGLHFPTVSAKPVGTVDQGISIEEQTAFTQIARDIQTRNDGKTQWVEPCLCCRVEYRDINEMHQLRQTSFRGFLFQKRPEDCRWHDNP